MVCNLLVHLDKKYSPYPLKKKKKALSIDRTYVFLQNYHSFACLPSNTKIFFSPKLKHLPRFFFLFREMPRFFYCRLNDIFSLIMTFRIGFEFLYQINKNVSTFKYYLEGGVNYIGVLWQYQIFFFLSVTQMLSMLHQV